MGLKIEEGKKPLSLEVYEFLAKEFYYSKKKEHIFGHLFFVLDWCLMKRAENCVNAQINHIYFENDSLVFQFAKSKGHRKGEKHVGPWHLYSNPYKPWLCPILALSRYLFCYPEVLRGDVPLFEGRQQYSRYCSIFNRMVKSCASELKLLGFEPGDLGTHSSRKGVATMIADGCTISPPIASLCIRAGWVMGGVKDKYIFRENGGDQYVGRCASCLDMLSKEFSVSPPHFDFSSLNPDERRDKKEEIHNFIQNRIPDIKHISPQTFHLVYMCFATVCYHYDELQKNMHPECILRNAALFRDIPKNICEYSKVAYPWDATSDTPKSTGVPPHVLVLAEMEALKTSIKDLQFQLLSNMKEEMDRRGFSDSSFQSREIIDAVKEHTDRVVNEILRQKNQHQNPEELSDCGVNEIVYDFIEEEGELFTTSNISLSHSKQTSRKRKHGEVMNAMKKRKFTIGFHHGKLNPLPANFQFPKMTAHQLIINWLLGDLTQNIPPYKNISTDFIKHIKYGIRKYNCMKVFMAFVENKARENECWYDKWTYEHCVQLWETVGQRFIINLFSNEKSRKRELSWKSIYNRMSLQGVFMGKN